jgi:hypothetical protein
MPADNLTNTSKRAHKESTRKRKGRENEEALQRERAEGKATAKARKDFRDEAAEVDLLVEREGDSSEYTKLRSEYPYCYLQICYGLFLL